MVTTAKLGEYTNGNYRVTLLTDGTKIRENDEDSLVPAFPENIDIKITNQCDMGCPYCHEGSWDDGEHGDILSPAFIDTLPPFTELAIGGGNPLAHPDLVPFLNKLRARNIIPNITVNQAHFEKHFSEILDLTKEQLVFGVGVSITSTLTTSLLGKLKLIPNAVLHVIAGIVEPELLRTYYDKDLKLLILGYKTLRRGSNYFSLGVTQRIAQLEENIMGLFSHFSVVAFDNLALEQLNMKAKLPKPLWDECYMGDDGQYTMYVDMVSRKFSASSTSPTRLPITDDVNSMFNVVRGFGDDKT